VRRPVREVQLATRRASRALLDLLPSKVGGVFAFIDVAEQELAARWPERVGEPRNAFLIVSPPPVLLAKIPELYRARGSRRCPARSARNVGRSRAPPASRRRDAVAPRVRREPRLLSPGMARTFDVRVFERQEGKRPGVELQELACKVEASHCDAAAVAARAEVAKRSPSRVVLATSHGRRDTVLITVSKAELRTP